jgi:hypothetical protein
MKRLVSAIILVMICCVGCDRSRSSSARPKPANERQVILPADPVLAGVVGRWGNDGHALVTITLLPDGLGLLQIPDPGEGWRIEASNGRIENGKIMYDQKYYVRDVPNHPMDGSCCTVTFEPIAGVKDRAKLTSKLQDSQPTAAVLSRLE